MDTHGASNGLEFAQQLSEIGYSRSFGVVEGSELRQLVAGARSFGQKILPWYQRPDYGEHMVERIPWFKSSHVYIPAIHQVACSPRILDRVEQILGPDLLLWGAEVVVRGPGAVHRWHVDVEHLAWTGVTVWMGLENVSEASTLKVIPRSHRIAETPQDLGRSKVLDTRDDDAVLGAARRLGDDLQAQITTLPISVGEAAVFSGRLWHASRNTSGDMRVALLLQYATPEADVRIPVSVDPPVRWHARKPPCCLVRGRDTHGRNVIVDPVRSGFAEFPHDPAGAQRPGVTPD